MNNRAECDECKAIIEELMRDVAKTRALSPKLKDELRARCEALFGMMGGREEDLERAEELLGKFQTSPPRPWALRMYERSVRTGHVALKALFRK